MDRMEYYLNGKKWIGSSQRYTNIIIDSGTSFVLMPYKDLRNFLDILRD